jgi:hypothetical protein
MAPKKIIIDSDPVRFTRPNITIESTTNTYKPQGVDDILAMLLAFSATPEEIKVALISLTFGNIDVKNCLRNTVSLFHHIDKEMEWRSENGKEPGFETLRASKPVVAVGAEEPLAEQLMMADFFRMYRLVCDDMEKLIVWQMALMVSVVFTPAYVYSSTLIHHG